MKKIFVLLIGILILSGCAISKTPEKGSSYSGVTMTSTTLSGNSNEATGSLGENTTNWDKRSFGKYIVIKSQPKDTVGENFTVMLNNKTIFSQNNNDTQTPGYFFNIVKDILIIDYGTGPSIREMSLINLANTKKIMTTEYIGKLNIINNAIEFNTKGDSTSVCDKAIIKNSKDTGLSITKVQKITFDFGTQKITNVGKTYCTLIQ